MIRQRVTRHGSIHTLPPPSSLPGCCMARDLVGVVKVGTVRKWYDHKKRWDARYKTTKARVHRKRLRDLAVGYEVFGEGEVPPPSALAGRRRLGGKELRKRKKAKGLGLALWGMWGSKHDQMTVKREERAGKEAEAVVDAGPAGEGQGAREFEDLERQERGVKEGGDVPSAGQTSKSRAWTGLVKDGEQVEAGAGVAPGKGELDLRPAGPVANPDKGETQATDSKTAGFLSPDDALDTGVTGKRVIIGGLATPFSLRKEPETASMITLTTPFDQSSIRPSTAGSGSFMAAPSVKVADDQETGDSSAPDTGETGDQEKKDSAVADNVTSRDQEKEDSAVPDDEKSREQDGVTPGFATPFMTPFLSPTSPGDRPGLERFVTAKEEVTKASA